ncbi:hypothetical protein [Marinomonas epiphytica]
MVLNDKLKSFFETPEHLASKRFPTKVRAELSALLSNTQLFKQQRMQALISQQNFTKLEWFEWFNWYYAVTQHASTPTWLMLAIEKTTSSKHVAYMGYPQLIEQGWCVQDIVLSSVMLSDSGIANYHANNDEIHHWCRLRSKNLGLFSGALVAGELVGQVGLIKLDRAEYLALRSGKLEEKDIQGVSDEFTGPIYLYVPSVVVKPEWRKSSLVFKLFTHLIKQLKQQPERLKHIEGLIALAYTDDGAHLCERFNFTLEHTMETGERAYTGSLNQLFAQFSN